jgi:transaldolase
VTSNPSIFAAALAAGDRYDDQLDELLAGGLRDPQALFFALALRDVAEAARLLRPTYDRTDGRDGYVSFECTPDVAHDTRATIRQAIEVWQRVDAPNLMVKVPATDAGMDAIEQLTFKGINVNVTLLFSAARHEQAARAYQRGLARRAAAGHPIDRVRSVASVFVSRIDARVEQLSGDRGAGSSVAIASARLVYARAREIFDGEPWNELRRRGASWQRPLWASTKPKNPAYAAVTYVEGLALPDTIVTVPEPTLLAFADHGQARIASFDADEARETVAGHDLEAIGARLEAGGVRAFAEAYGEILARIGEHAQSRCPGEALA